MESQIDLILLDRDQGKIAIFAQGNAVVVTIEELPFLMATLTKMKEEIRAHRVEVEDRISSGTEARHFASEGR